MAESNELIVIEKASVHDVFTKAEKLDPIIAQIRAMVSSVVPDTTAIRKIVWKLNDAMHK